MPVQNTVKLLRIFEASGCHCERTFSKFSFEICRDLPCFYHVFGGIYHGFTGICRGFTGIQPDSTTVLLGFVEMVFSGDYHIFKMVLLGFTMVVHAEQSQTAITLL